MLYKYDAERTSSGAHAPPAEKRMSAERPEGGEVPGYIPGLLGEALRLPQGGTRADP